MNFPKPLKKGDNVFLLCPSSPVIAEEDIKKCSAERTAQRLG